MNPDISVVIPTFRRPGLLAEALRSALAPSGVTLEVLVLDDSPEGSARDVIASIEDPRVKYRKREVPAGGNPALVRNEGWRSVRGGCIHFLDDDDRGLPGVYREVVDAVKAHPRQGVAFGRVAPFGDDADALAHERTVFSRAARRARLFQRWGSWRCVVATASIRALALAHGVRRGLGV